MILFAVDTLQGNYGIALMLLERVAARCRATYKKHLCCVHLHQWHGGLFPCKPIHRAAAPDAGVTRLTQQRTMTTITPLLSHFHRLHIPSLEED